MHQRFFLTLVTSSITTLAASLAAAQPAPPDEVQGERAVHEERVVVHAANVGIGTDWGLWGEGFAQSVHLDVPLFGNRQGAFGFRARGIMVYNPPTSNRFDPALIGDLELFGRGPVLLGLARLYGGGGVFLGEAPNAVAKSDRNLRVAGGGHMGIEIFSSAYNSFYVEIGGQAPLHPSRFDAGGSVMGGITFYPFGR